jgi:RimJ/RimL family protein N-acetyltransferase
VPIGRAGSTDCENGRVDPEDWATLTVDELVLRPWRPTDAPAVFAVCQDPEIGRWVTIPQPFTRADADAFIETGLQMWRDGTGAPFAIVDSGSDRLLGAVTRFGPDGHQATFGLWLAPDARGRGIGTRALRRVADWTFETTAAIRLDAFIMVGNEPSHRMVERAGFQREGIARAWDLHHDGVPVDCVVYSRIRGDA